MNTIVKNKKKRDSGFFKSKEIHFILVFFNREVDLKRLMQTSTGEFSIGIYI